VVSDAVATAILDFAGQEGVNLIAMSTHGLSGFSRWVYGSVAEKVLQGAGCPALLIRAKSEG
jgi:nucleotide-binding universal stress UspA family protein